jgi:DNA-binding response OmpR family regulator
MESKKIMVVEDEKLTMLFITETLEDYGYEDILEYAYGQDIIDTIKQGTVPDLILMDINIKGAKDGIQTATEILKLCNIPIVFMSAYNDKRTIKEVLAVSLYGFLSKPFNERELYIALEIAWKNFYQHTIIEEPLIEKKIKLYSDCYYEIETQNLYLDNKLITLSHNQQILLETLIKDVNSIVDKELLSYKIWGTKEESSSALRTVVYLLRKKLNGIQISSQSKHGYLLKASYL